MAARRRLTISEEASEELKAYRDHDKRAYVRERCGAMLKIAAGETPNAVAKAGLLKARDPDTVYGWLDAYEAEGIGGLVARQQGGDHRRSP
jgi:hypothetical protein